MLQTVRRYGKSWSMPGTSADLPRSAIEPLDWNCSYLLPAWRGI